MLFRVYVSLLNFKLLRGLVGSGYAVKDIALMERLKELEDRMTQSSLWMQFLSGSGEQRYHGGDEENSEQEDGW